METINNLELRDEFKYPDDTVLMSILQDSFLPYKKLLQLFTMHDMTYEWRYYHDGKAWLCKVQKKKKTIVWMSAWKGFIQATIYFPEKYVDPVFALDICDEIKTQFSSAKNVGKSKPFIFKIQDGHMLKNFETVMLYKIGCR